MILKNIGLYKQKENLEKKMKHYLLVLCAIFVGLLYAYEPFFMDEPTISPDGERVTFVYVNNLWEVSFQGGTARRLTSGDDDITRPLYSPDGQWIVFRSNRDGRPKLYKIPVTGGLAELISHEEVLLRDWYADGKSMLVSKAFAGELFTYLKMDLDGSRPNEIAQAYGSFATISNDGKKLVFNLTGIYDTWGDPFRPAYQGSINGNLWLYDTDTKKFSQITNTPFTEGYPRFSRTKPDRLYFTASDGNVFNICYIDIASPPMFSPPVEGAGGGSELGGAGITQLTHFTDWSARNLSIACQNDRMVFELFNEIWSYDPNTKQANKIKIDIAEDNLPQSTVYETLQNEISQFYVSDNNKLLVFAAKFDLFAMPLNGSQVKQLTFNQKGVKDICIMNDNETIYYVSQVQGIPKLFSLSLQSTVNSQQSTVNYQQSTVNCQQSTPLHSQYLQKPRW
jgi:tricorn protease